MRICGCESDFDLDVLSGMQCGVSRGKVMCVNCVRLFKKLLCVCIVGYLIEAIFPLSFYPSPFWMNKLNSATVWNLQGITKAFLERLTNCKI